MSGALTAKGRATRERLLVAAREVLREHGGLEIADVASRAAVAPSVLYRYFGSKSGLVTAVIAQFYDRYDETVFLARVAPGEPWPVRERRRIELEVDFLYDHPLGRRVAAGLLHDAAATREDATRQRRHVALAARNIRRGQRDGELDAGIDADLVAAAIIGALRAVLAEALGQDPPPPRAGVVEVVDRLASALLRLPPPREARSARPP